MKDRVIFSIALSIMIIALLCMGINLTVVSLPDWTVRIAGIVILADLAVLRYLTMRSKKHTSKINR